MREKELRLALVCYGGISLAVYMHGITKEIWRLAGASRAVHDGATALAGAQGVYQALLLELEKEGGARIRVLPDIVAGASAGGINGIFLAQAIATGQSLEPLTELWLTSADVEALIDPDAAPSSRFSKMWAVPLAWVAAGRGKDKVELLDPATRDEVKTKLSHLIRSRWFEPPFGGAAFTGLLLDALDAMAASERGPRLLPPGQPVDLFVTVTDFTGHPERLRLHSPPEVVETEHRIVVAFSDHGEAVDTLAALPELAFAARATSSFPGTFPFSVAELDGVLKARRRGWPGRKAFLARVLPRQAAANAADRAVLIDGSVLANAPFRPAIEALAQRPAKRQIDRRFVYIDPKPGMKFSLAGGGETPGWFQTILGAISELPRQQPIRDNLEAIAARSARTERLRGIVAAIRPTVEAEVEALFGEALGADRPTAQRLATWRRRSHTRAVAAAGYAHTAYLHLKLAGVADTLAALLAAQARVAPALLALGLTSQLPTAWAEEAVVAFLRSFDLRFRIRRLRLLARRLADMEAEGDEAALAPVRDAIYGALARYLECGQAESHGLLKPLVRARPDWPALLAALAASLDLTRLDAETDAGLAAAFARLPPPLRQPLLLAYLGFPWFDVATLPLLQGEGLDEFDAIKVDRIAPDDATAIRTGGAEATLKGVQFNSFGAFFSRAYRENDYLWGRLHGAERLIDIAVSTSPNRLKPGRVAAIKRRAFLAILDEEQDRLTAVQPLIASLREEIG